MNNTFLEIFKSQTKEEISKLNYKKYFYQFNEDEKLKIAKNLKDIEIFFKEELDIDIYPIYGTLLGMVRDNDFINWDTDIDMAYLSKCRTPKAVLNEFNLICKFLEERNLLLKRIKTASHLHIYSPNKGLKIDLWISWVDENFNYHLVWSVDGDITANMILPFKSIEFKNQTFRQMNNPEQFLNEQYVNWKEPLFGSQIAWAKRKPRFELEQWKGN